MRFLAKPVFGPDGTVYVYALVGDTPEYQSNLTALNAAGHAKPGWPVEETTVAGDFGIIDRRTRRLRLPRGERTPI